MTRDELHARLREEALANSGKVALSAMLSWLVPIAELRELARAHGRSPKGFRLEKAPVRVLAALLAEPDAPEVLSEVCKALATHMTAGLAAGSSMSTSAPAPATTDLQPILKLKEQELALARAEVGKARDAAQGLRDRVADLTRLSVADRNRITLQDKELADLRGELVRQRSTQPVVHRDQSSRILSLSKELEEQYSIEQQQRMRLAEQAAEVRDRDERIAELEALLPAGTRKKKKLPPPPAPDRFVVPHFSPSFLKSLDGKERRSIEQAYHAVFMFCTEGSRYPGLQVKLLEATNLWSLRASLRLRVYFRRRGDGDVEILELSDREDQETLLRRYKERQG